MMIYGSLINNSITCKMPTRRSERHIANQIPLSSLQEKSQFTLLFEIQIESDILSKVFPRMHHKANEKV